MTCSQNGTSSLGLVLNEDLTQPRFDPGCVKDSLTWPQFSTCFYHQFKDSEPKTLSNGTPTRGDQKMRKLTFVLIIASALFVSDTSAQRGRPPASTDTRAIVLFGSCASGDTACEFANRVRQDIAGVPYKDGESGVSTVFNRGSGSRDLTINLITSQRSVMLDLRVFTGIATVPGSAMPPWWVDNPQQLVKIGINVLGAYYAKENCPPEAAECNFVTKMNAGKWRVDGYPSTEYAVLWNPNPGLDRKVNLPQSTVFVNVRYIRNDGSGEKYEIAPIPNESGQSIAGLESSTKKSVNYAGQFDMPFFMTVRTFF